MATERTAEAQEPDVAPWAALGWKVAFVIGAVSVILGLIVAFHPSTSLNVIAILLGILLVLSGIFHIAGTVAREEEHGKLWRGIAGVLLILGGVALIRHLDLSVALIGLLIGATWIVQGVASLVVGISLGPGMPGRWWPLLFGLVSLIAGIVVVSTPVSAVTTLATLMGIWFVVMGAFEMVGALATRGAIRRATRSGPVSVPGPRPGDRPDADREPGGTAATGRKAQG